MNILHIDCSPRLESYSRQLSAAIVARLVALEPKARIIRRDLGFNPIPHASAAYATALSSPATLASAAGKEALRLSEQLIQEVETADVVVIGTPMHNFTVPSVLKAWIDQLLRIGRTFASTPNGKVGLIADKPVFIGIASGGVFSGDRANQPDFLTPYLTAAFGCVGLQTLHFLSLQATAFLAPERLEATRNALLAKLDVTAIAHP